MKTTIPFLCFIILFACNQPAKQETKTQQPQLSKTNPTPIPLEGGNKIVLLTDFYTDYMNAVKTDFKDKDSLYKAKISWPIYNKYFANGEYASLAQMNYYMPIMDTTGLAARVAELNNKKEDLIKLVTASLAACNKYLRNDSITVYIEPTGGNNKKISDKMNGITAVTTSSKQILLSIDPSVSSWTSMLPYTLSHEFNHTYWTVHNLKTTAKFTMLTYLVFEGRADSYAHFVNPTIDCPWANILTDKEKAEQWAKIKPQLQSEDSQFQRQVMFGSNGYPLWTGYCLGYNIVQSALKNNPKLTPEEWTSMEPEKILEMSDYK
jgi:uncharacterized protein YjaZ